GYSSALEQRQSNHDIAVRERTKAKAEYKQLKRNIERRRAVAASEHTTRSKRGLAKNDSDAREKIDRARVSDGKAGNALRQLSGRFVQAGSRLQSATVSKKYPTGIWLPGSRSQRDYVLAMDAGQTSLGSKRWLQWPDLVVRPNERIAITGPNGAGKSTFLRSALAQLNVPSGQAIVMPQEVTVSDAKLLMAETRNLNSTELGHAMTIVSRLNSRPERLLESCQLSPGETRKLLLALGMVRLPHIIVMDEPTNHLDLPSIEALEAALANCPCAVLLVSHDDRFIENVQARRWAIRRDNGGDATLLTH
ncbi:MAG: ABC-F family ATP-binding cassette domain-containing protein, partial [Halioglobus sp.]|nr:ABC-F family ATP-binding cassette domain-containing protein [Halioglobus sp.]